MHIADVTFLPCGDYLQDGCWGLSSDTRTRPVLVSVQAKIAESPLRAMRGKPPEVPELVMPTSTEGCLVPSASMRRVRSWTSGSVRSSQAICALPESQLITPTRPTGFPSSTCTGMPKVSPPSEEKATCTFG